MPQISVIMSVYKEPLDWMAQSIDSILNQIYSDFEFLIVDDNPTDDKLIYFLNDYQKKDSRIKIIVNEQNVGLTKSLNIAIKQAQGKYIARMDADDISCKNRFQVRYDYMEQHLEVDVCGSWAYKIGEMSLLDERKIILPTCNDDIRLGFLFSSQIIHPSVFVRSEVIKMYYYNETVIKAQDYDLWASLIIAGRKICNIPKCLLYYRVTRKSQKIEYTNLQQDTANNSRGRLLDFFLPNENKWNKRLHNNICTGKIDSAAEAKGWLEFLHDYLSSTYPQSEIFLKNTFNKIWFNVCQTTNNDFSFYRSSVLYSFSIIIYLRFIKNKLISISRNI